MRKRGIRKKREGPFPILEEIVNGWAALDEGWAVHAPTKEEAIAKHGERKVFYEWLLTQPPIYERVDEYVEG